MEKLLHLVRSHPDVGPAHAIRDLAGEEGLGTVSKSTMAKLWRYLDPKERKRIFPQRAGVKFPKVKLQQVDSDGRALPSKKPKHEPGVCRQCGCTDERACPEGCCWVDAEETKCSACFPELIDQAHASLVDQVDE